MSKILKTMLLFNYSPNLDGMCFGISVMAAQAALREGNKVFANRIKFIQNCTEAEIKTIINSEKNNRLAFNKKLDLLCFFDGVSIYQGMGGVNSGFKAIASKTQRIDETIKLVKSETLSHDDKLVYPEIKMRLINAYTREAFLHFIKETKKHFNQQPFSVLITHSPVCHATQIGFDGKNWLATNHDFAVLGEDTCEDIAKVVNSVFQPKQYGSAERMVAIFDIVLPENMRIDYSAFKAYDFSVDNLSDAFDKEMLSHMLASFVEAVRYDTYLNILQKIPSLTLAENEKIALIESKRIENSTVIHFLAYYGRVQVLNQIIKTMDDLGLSFETKISILNKKNSKGLSALYYAAQNGHLEVVTLLLKQVLFINNSSLKANFLLAGKSTLFMAASGGNIAVACALIKAIFTIKDKAIRNACLLANVDGMSALFVAAANGHKHMVKELIKTISMVEDKEVRMKLLTSTNKEGESALSVAEQQNYKTIAKLLRTKIEKERLENEKRPFSQNHYSNSCVIS